MVKKVSAKRAKGDKKVDEPSQQEASSGRRTSARKKKEVEAQDETPQDAKDQQEKPGEPENDEEGEHEGEEECSGSAGKKRKKPSATATAKKNQNEKSKTEAEICTERHPLERIPLPSEEKTGMNKTFTVLSWNVNGIRAIVSNGLSTLRRMVETERPDLVCFQETKLQEKDVEGIKQQDLLPGYDSAWSCSTTKKGYAGSAVFFPKQVERWAVSGEDEDDRPAAKKQKKQEKISTFFAGKGGKGSRTSSGNAAEALPGGRSGLKVLGVRFGIDDSKHDGEGRSITVEYDKFFVVTLYVPNSGQKLERLSYRTQDWDPALRAYVEKLEAEGKPVVVTGDLNVAHLDLDIYNQGAKHILKSAGTTKEERESFDSWMKEGKMLDAFRQLYPNAGGAYTYWSVRTNARPVNKGLRLDYFLCSKNMFDEKIMPSSMGGGGSQKSAAGKGPKRRGKKKTGSAEGAVTVHDCFQLEKATVGLSDHCPVGLVLRI